MPVGSLGQEDLEQQMGSNSSILAQENFMDRGVCWAAVRKVAKSWTPLSMHVYDAINTEFANASILLEGVKQQDFTTWEALNPNCISFCFIWIKISEYVWLVCAVVCGEYCLYYKHMHSL